MSLDFKEITEGLRDKKLREIESLEWEIQKENNLGDFEVAQLLLIEQQTLINEVIAIDLLKMAAGTKLSATSGTSSDGTQFSSHQSKNKQGLFSSILSASNNSTLRASEYIESLIEADPRILQRARAIINIRKEFCEYATQNVDIFADGTYFLASMEKAINPNNDQLFLYPGSGSSYREGMLIPDKFRDLNAADPLKMHPDLDLQIRQKAHRVLEEGILEKNISLLHTLLPHPFVDDYPSRGGGAVLSGNVLRSTYKSGVLNGKWSLPLIGENLKYGDLPDADRARFNQAMVRATGKTVVAPDKSVIEAKSSGSHPPSYFFSSMIIGDSNAPEKVYAFNEDLSAKMFERRWSSILRYLNDHVTSDLVMPGKKPSITYINYLKEHLAKANNMYDMEVCILGVYHAAFKDGNNKKSRLKIGLEFLMASDEYLGFTNRYGIHFTKMKKFGEATLEDQLLCLFNNIMKYKTTALANPMFYQQGIRLLLQLQRWGLTTIENESQAGQLVAHLAMLMKSVCSSSVASQSDSEDEVSLSAITDRNVEDEQVHRTLKLILLDAYKGVFENEEDLSSSRSSSSFNPSASSVSVDPAFSRLAIVIRDFMRVEFNIILPECFTQMSYETIKEVSPKIVSPRSSSSSKR